MMPIISPTEPPMARPANAVTSVSRVVVRTDPSATASTKAARMALGGASESMSVRLAMRPAISPATINATGKARPFHVSDEITSVSPRTA
jgi:hypothetical protein